MSYHHSTFHPEPLAAFPSGTPDRFAELRRMGEQEADRELTGPIATKLYARTAAFASRPGRIASPTAIEQRRIYAYDIGSFATSRSGGFHRCVRNLNIGECFGALRRSRGPAGCAASCIMARLLITKQSQ
jgi:hypothetical protein